MKWHVYTSHGVAYGHKIQKKQQQQQQQQTNKTVPCILKAITFILKFEHITKVRSSVS